MKRDEEVTRTKDDVEMVKRTHLWPGTFLHMKRQSRPGQRGSDYNAFGAISKSSPLRIVTDTESFDFESAEAMIAAGWLVD